MTLESQLQNGSVCVLPLVMTLYYCLYFLVSSKIGLRLSSSWPVTSLLYILALALEFGFRYRCFCCPAVIEMALTTVNDRPFKPTVGSLSHETSSICAPIVRPVMILCPARWSDITGRHLAALCCGGDGVSYPLHYHIGASSSRALSRQHLPRFDLDPRLLPVQQLFRSRVRLARGW